MSCGAEQWERAWRKVVEGFGVERLDSRGVALAEGRRLQMCPAWGLGRVTPSPVPSILIPKPRSWGPMSEAAVMWGHLRLCIPVDRWGGQQDLCHLCCLISSVMSKVTEIQVSRSHRISAGQRWGESGV